MLLNQLTCSSLHDLAIKLRQRQWRRRRMKCRRTSNHPSVRLLPRRVLVDVVTGAYDAQILRAQSVYQSAAVSFRPAVPCRVMSHCVTWSRGFVPTRRAGTHSRDSEHWAGGNVSYDDDASNARVPLRRSIEIRTRINHSGPTSKNDIIATCI